MGLHETAFHPSGAFHLLDRLWWEASFGSSKVNEQDRFWNMYERCPDAIWHLPVRDLPLAFPMELPHWQRATEPEAEQETIRLADIRSPVMHIGGWHDAFTGALLRNYRILSERADPRPQSLIIGPWTHEVNQPPLSVPQLWAEYPFAVSSDGNELAEAHASGRSLALSVRADLCDGCQPLDRAAGVAAARDDNQELLFGRNRNAASGTDTERGGAAKPLSV